MSNQVWILIAVVVIVAIIVAYQRSRKSQVRDTRDLRMGAQELDRAQSPEEEISQREDRRLSGMSVEDREWEQASQQRNRDIQHEPTRQAQGAEDLP
jgi:FtsZ-interacting cell division protein ZipA